MKKRKAVWIMTFMGVLFALSCIVPGKALAEGCAGLNGSYSMQKVLVSVKNQADRRDANSFSLDDIKRLKDELSSNDLTYTVQSGLISTPVSNGGTPLPVRLTGVDFMYPQFCGLTLENGSFITQKQEDEGEMVAVIDDELARDIFKSVNVTGKTIDIFGGVFRIAGVVKKDGSIIGKLTDDGLPDIYIPAAVMLEMDNTARISYLQIKTADKDTLGRNTANISEALSQIGKNPSNYNISDYNLRYALMEQVPLIFIFILGIASILFLLAYIKNIIKRLYFFIRDGCRTDYFSNVLRHNLAGIGAHMLEIAVVLLGMALIWQGIKFRPYIPPQYIPDELINVSYYSDLIKSLIQGGIQNMGYIPPRPELAADTAALLIDILFYISVIPGFLLLYAGFRELKAVYIDIGMLTVIFGLFFIFSLGALAAAVLSSGLPFLFDIKGILVAWVFIFLYILHIQQFALQL